MLINSFLVNKEELSAEAQDVLVTIKGDAGAQCKLYVRNEDPKYCNFFNNTYQSAFTPETILNIVIPDTEVYTTNIPIPAITDDDQYDFHLFVDGFTNTKIDNEIKGFNKTSSESGNGEKNMGNEFFISKSIKQFTAKTLTFSVATTDDGFGSMPDNVTFSSHKSAILNEAINISWDFTAVDSTSGGGLEITRQPLLSDFKISITPSTVGSGSSSKKMYLNSVNNLFRGMNLTSITSGSVSGSPIITGIDIEDKSVTLSVAQTWADNKAITFKGNGAEGLAGSYGGTIVSEKMNLSLAVMTAKVTPAVSSSQNITLDNSYGVRVGAKVSGIGFDNSTEQLVTATSYAGNTVEVTSAQTLANNTVLTFTGSSTGATINTVLRLTKMPDSDVTMTLDLDSLLTSALT